MERFWSKVNKTPSCWLWAGDTRKNGYGRFSFKGRGQSAHRVAWLLTKGAIPDGLCVLHKCDVRQCVNPEHLFLGTQADNLADRNIKGRGTFGVRNGRAKLTEERVREIKEDYRTTGATYDELAAEYGVSWSTIRNIFSGANWSHVI